MDASTDSQTIGGALVGAMVGTGAWVFKSLFRVQDEQKKQLAALEIKLVGEYVPREEIEARMDRLQESVEKRIDRLQESIDKILNHLHHRDE